MLLRRFFFIPIGLLMVLFIAACGSNTSTGGGPYGTGSSSTGSTTTPSSTPTTTGSSNSSVMIKTATAQVNAKSVTILTNAGGKTLYYFTPDTATTAACTGTGNCTNMWPPLLFTGTGSPTSSSMLSGTLSAQTDANGNQVEYNGHPLYLFSGDTAAGQTNGEGIFGKWFVATPDLSSQGGGSSNGYGN
ncbi:MAG: hypothetical protein ACJ8CB_11205 [Ktedonobacteraceae bacterium]